MALIARSDSLNILSSASCPQLADTNQRRRCRSRSPTNAAAALARPVTVISAGAVPSTIAAMMRGETKGRQQADMPFALGFTLGNLGEAGDPTEPDVVDPFPRVADCGEQSIAVLGLHCRF
jgi:hypothetical protein